MASATPTGATSVQTRQRGGKYLTFVLAHEEYGLEILKVREINGLMPITPVPRTPEVVRGVINLRGKVIPVIDLRRKFGMPAAEATEQTCIIVVDDGRIEMGIIVDKLTEVLHIDNHDIQDAPSFAVNVDTAFILGMGKANGRVTILLDISRVLTTDDMAEVAAAAAGN